VQTAQAAYVEKTYDLPNRRAARTEMNLSLHRKIFFCPSWR